MQIGASSKTCFVRLSREFLLESEWAERSSIEDLRLFLLQHQYDELISKHWGFLLWYHNSKKEIPDFTWTYNDKLIMTSESEWMNVSYSFTWSISIYIAPIIRIIFPKGWKNLILITYLALSFMLTKHYHAKVQTCPLLLCHAALMSFSSSNVKKVEF